MGTQTIPRADVRSTRGREVLEQINTLADPCSAAAGDPVGLADLGLVTAVEVDGGRVRVRVRPTFPGCMFVGIFEQEVKRAVRSLTWCTEVDVEIDSSTGWTEDDIEPAVRARLELRRRRARDQLSEAHRRADANPTGHQCKS